MLVVYCLVSFFLYQKHMNSSLCLSYNNILIFPVFPICQLQRTDTYNQIINKRGTADRTKKLINIPVCDEHGDFVPQQCNQKGRMCWRCWLSTVWYHSSCTINTPAHPSFLITLLWNKISM
jgi:hypothetical protein